MTEGMQLENKDSKDTPDILRGYLINVSELRVAVQEMGAQLATADERNEKVHAVYDNLSKAGVGETTIMAALAAEFGKAKGAPRKPRAPTRTDKTPTDLEARALSVMTGEPMNKRQIFASAKIDDTALSAGLLSGMQRMGWIKNEGSKGAGAAWVLTQDGLDVIDSK